MTRSEFLFLPFSFPFSWPFYDRYLLLFISFLTTVKSWVLIISNTWKWLIDLLWYNKPFTNIFAPKTDHGFLDSLCQKNSKRTNHDLTCGSCKYLIALTVQDRYPKGAVVGIDLS